MAPPIDRDTPRDVCVLRHDVDRKIEPHPWTEAEDGCKAEGRRLHATARMKQIFHFGLCARVKRHRSARARLRQTEPLAVTVHRTRRRIDVPAYSHLERRADEAFRTVDVHAASELRLELARGIVRNPGQVDHGIDALQQGAIEGADVAANDA
jgi:hypothetical protein